MKMEFTGTMAGMFVAMAVSRMLRRFAEMPDLWPMFSTTSLNMMTVGSSDPDSRQQMTPVPSATMPSAPAGLLAILRPMRKSQHFSRMPPSTATWIMPNKRMLANTRFTELATPSMNTPCICCLAKSKETSAAGSMRPLASPRTTPARMAQLTPMSRLRVFTQMASRSAMGTNMSRPRASAMPASSCGETVAAPAPPRRKKSTAETRAMATR